MLLGGKTDAELPDTLLNDLGLKDRVSHLPSQLSGGQQQRVAIGRALITRPAIILADEPTGNLDQKNSEEILKLLKESNQKYKQTIIIVTHDNNVAEMCTKQIEIRDGRVVQRVDG